MSPLTWSHGTYIATAHRILRRLAAKQAAAGAAATPYLRPAPLPKPQPVLNLRLRAAVSTSIAPFATSNFVD